MKTLAMVGTAVLLTGFVLDELAWASKASMSGLPKNVQAALVSLCREPCVFADAGGRWNATDVVDGSPRRRLVSVTHVDSKWVIQYEHGGIGRHNHRVVFDLVPAIHIANGSSCVPSSGQVCEW